MRMRFCAITISPGAQGNTRSGGRISALHRGGLGGNAGSRWGKFPMAVLSRAVQHDERRDSPMNHLDHKPRKDMNHGPRRISIATSLFLLFCALPVLAATPSSGTLGASGASTTSVSWNGFPGPAYQNEALTVSSN